MICGSHAGRAVGYEEEVHRLEADVDILAVQVSLITSANLMIILLLRN